MTRRSKKAQAARPTESRGKGGAVMTIALLYVGSVLGGFARSVLLGILPDFFCAGID